MQSNKELEITLPSAVYYADPHAAVRSILGNDVSIISLEVLDIILPNENIIVKATYNSVDFNAFKLYKVLETKVLSQQSKKYVATKIVDTITGEVINDTLINLNDTPTKKEFYILIKYFQNNFVKYYGTEVNLSNFKQNYISIFDSAYLSYHGSALEIPKVPEIKPSELSPTYETSVFKSLIKVKNSNFTNSCLDISYIHKYICGSSLAKLQTLEVCDLNNLKDMCIFTFKDINELDKLVGSKYILILCAGRKCLMSCILIYDQNTELTQNAINNTKLVLSYDLYNYNLLTEQS